MRFAEQHAQFERDGYAVFERVLEGSLLDLLRHECARVIEREDARLDALGVEVDGISHKGKRYFAGECQRVQPALRDMLFSETMAEICRATPAKGAPCCSCWTSWLAPARAWSMPPTRLASRKTSLIWY